MTFGGMLGKVQVSAFQNSFQMENQLNIKNVMSKDVYVPSFDPFDIALNVSILCT